jgi:beta-galactosidase
VVRVEATQYEGWFYEGAGIYRHVWLNLFDNLHITDGGLFVYAEVRDKNARVNIETTVENQNSTAANCSVYSYIAERDVKILSQTIEQALSLSINTKGKIKQQISLSNPRLWSLEDPYLYRLVSVVKSGKKIQDIVKSTFGIKTMEV